MTQIYGTYSAFTCTNLTQSVTRDATQEPITPMVLTSTENYARELIATFTINSTSPASITLTTTTPNLVLGRVGDVYTVSSKYTTNAGITVNNWAYFKHLLQNLTIVTDNTVWPNPAFTISVSITDGTTTRTGTISVSEAIAVAPSTPADFTIERIWDTGVKLDWTASTQASPPGVAGYYVYRNVTTSVFATVSGGGTVTWTDTSANNAVTYTYYIQAFDSSLTPLTSAITSGLSTAGAVPPTKPIISNTSSNKQSPSFSWSESTQAVGPGIAGYKIYRNNVLYDTLDSATFSWGETLSEGENYRYQVEAYDLLTIPQATRSDEIGAKFMFNKGNPSAYGYTNAFSYTYNPANIIESADTLYYTKIESAGPRYVTVMPGNTSSNKLAYSTDGIIWAEATLASSGSWDSVLFGNGVFVVIRGDNSTNYATSTDGINWISRTLPNPSLRYGGTMAVDKRPPKIINFCNGRFFILGSGCVMSSIDGVVWDTTTTFGNECYAPIYANGVYAAFKRYETTSSTYYTSTDGTTWTSRTLPVSMRVQDPGSNSAKFLIIGMTNSTYAGVPPGYTGPNLARVYHSTDGINWTESDLSSGNNLTFGESSDRISAYVEYTGSRFFVTSTFNQFGVLSGTGTNTPNTGYTSSNGNNSSWSMISLPQGYTPGLNIAFGDNFWMAGGNSLDPAMYSSDGINFTNCAYSPSGQAHFPTMISYG